MAVNKVLGAGKLYWEQEDANGDLAGSEVLLAETPSLTQNVATERVTDDNSDGAIAEQDLDVATKVVRSLAFSSKDISTKILALFMLGGESVISQSNTPVVGELVGKAVDNGYMQLGKSLSYTGVRAVSSVVIKVGAVTKVLDTDYALNAALGRIFIIEEGSILEGDEVLADFTPEANTRKQITTDQLGSKAGALRFIADNTVGENKDAYIPKVTLSPNGDLNWKSRDTVQNLAFDGSIGTRVVNGVELSQIYIDSPLSLDTPAGDLPGTGVYLVFNDDAHIVFNDDAFITYAS